MITCHPVMTLAVDHGRKAFNIPNKQKQMFHNTLRKSEIYKQPAFVALKCPNGNGAFTSSAKIM